MIDVDRFGDIFRHHFSLYFTTPENSYVATGLMRNACVGLSRPPIFTSKIHQQIILFQDTFLQFFMFYVDCIEKVSIWGPRLNPVGAQTGPKIDQVAPDCQKLHDLFPPWMVLFATSFS